MHTRISLNHNLLRRLVEELGRNPAATFSCASGINRLRESTNLLAYDLEREFSSVPAPHHLLVCGGIDPASLAGSIRRALARPTRSLPGAVLGLGVGNQSGDVAGVFRVGDSFVPLDEVVLQEPGLPRVRLGFRKEGRREIPVSPLELETWSRSIGALGEAAWRRLTELHFGVIGCGRSGMEVATSLARLGAAQITVIDADRIETGNLGELFPGVSIEDVGQLKSQVLASLLSAQRPSRLRQLTAVPESISSQPSLIAAKNTDFLISCVDTPVARAATAFLAKLYLLPLLDVGTGIHRHAAEGGGTETGADIRLVLPDRCLLCFGGIREIDVVRQQQALIPHRGPGHRRVDWQTERAGSLRSLNMMSVGIGLRLVEELVRGRLRGSAWLQLDYGANGIPSLRSLAPDRPSVCSMCPFTGHGDDGIHRFADAIGVRPGKDSR